MNDKLREEIKSAALVSGEELDNLEALIEALITQAKIEAVKEYKEELVSSLEANLLDGDKVQAGQMIASTEIKSWLLEALGG